MAKRKPIIVPPVDLDFEEAMRRLLTLKPDTETTVDLPSNCALCGGAVTLQFRDWVARTEGDPHARPSIQSTWPCPYCEKENGGFFPGKLAWVTKRIEDSGEKH